MTTGTIRSWTQRVKNLYKKHGYSVEEIRHSPISDSIYFTVRNPKGRFDNEVRVSDHMTPRDGHKGYQFIVTDPEMCEETLSDIEWEISD